MIRLAGWNFLFDQFLYNACQFDWHTFCLKYLRLNFNYTECTYWMLGLNLSLLFKIFMSFMKLNFLACTLKTIHVANFNNDDKMFPLSHGFFIFNSRHLSWRSSGIVENVEPSEKLLICKFLPPCCYMRQFQLDYLEIL